MTFPKKAIIVIFIIFSLSACETINDASSSTLSDAIQCGINSDMALSNWVWNDKYLSQQKDEESEFVLCAVYGFYKKAQYISSIHYSINRYYEVTTLDPKTVFINFLSKGKKISPPNFETPKGLKTANDCAQDNTMFSCLVAIQYDPETIFYVRVDSYNEAPMSDVEKIINSIIASEDVLIRKYFLP